VLQALGGASPGRRACTPHLLRRELLAGQVPYFWAGLKAYDFVAGTSALAWSHFLGAEASREVFPTLLMERPDGNTLKGSVSGGTLLRSPCASLTATAGGCADRVLRRTDERRSC